MAARRRSKHQNGQDETEGLRIAVYIRVSSTRQAMEGDSLEAQRNDSRKGIDYRSSMHCWNVKSIEHYVDAGRSAKDQNRPELQRLKSDIVAGRIDLVIVVKLDRLTRSLLDFVELWALFSNHGVRLVSLREDFDTSTPMGEAMLKLIMVFAELERKLTAERTLATMNDRTERGLWNGGFVYGYQSDPDDPGKLTVDAEWAAIIKTHFFDAFEELGSVGAVQRRLRKVGIRLPRTKTKHGKLKGGKPFAKQQIARVLRNRIYLGELHWGDAKCLDSHEPIIDRRQFDRVQQKLDVTTKTRSNHRHSEGRCHLLRGLIQFGCGAMMTPKSANGRTGKYYYYTCSRQNHMGHKTDCKAPMIPAEALEEAVIDRVVKIGVNLGDREKILEAAMREIDDDSRKLASKIDIARHRLTCVQAEIGNLLEVLKHMGKSGIASVGDELKQLEMERDKLQEDIKAMTEQESPFKRMSEAGQAFLENWTGIGEILAGAEPDEQRCVLHHFIQSLELTFLDTEEKRAEYSLTLFPEVGPGNFGPQNEKETVPSDGNGLGVLTPEAVFCHKGQKAPPVGLEPIVG
ncbi:recombinase family protein [bacterium]|nr:recombinase family protein [bacterium]